MAIRLIILIITLPLLLIACNQGEQEAKSPDYETTKKMVVDILKTDDGKTALQEVLTEEELKQQLVMQSDEVQQGIERVVAGEEGKEFWKTLFEDPSFVQTFITATMDQDKELIKGLMHDSEYQDQLITIFQNEQMQQMVLSILKSQDFKAHLEQSIQETLNSPMFKAQMTEALIKAAEEMEPSSEEGQVQEDQQQGSGSENEGGSGESSGNGESGGSEGEGEGGGTEGP
ncbi:spore germination lipoprotein GerD [Halalkalibacillus halophilus]|uniref:spore germination lipoprotein GerD n=1 Tax=Halalkalibacillus halophilus TaxID=392827 RepID=UPI0003FEA314|nr:spore germination lipoprotein GerD [Halalkalibacillus halophilus]